MRIASAISICSIAAVVMLLIGKPQQASADLILVDQFDPNIGQIVGLGFDHVTDTVGIHGDFDPDLGQYTRTGSFLSSIARPGVSANDFDIEFAPEALTLGGTLISAGTLLAINGESGTAEIYAADKSTGTILATLNTSFGLSHVVGGAFHPGRDTFFLVQDRQPSGTANDSVVAEIDPGDGSVLNSFRITDALSSFTVNFGDIDVAANGNLFVVSSDESTIGEFTPVGLFVQEHSLPFGVTSLSGIGLDNLRGEAWVSGTGGDVWRLGGAPAVPEPNSFVLCGLGAVSLLVYGRCRHRSQRPSGPRM